MELMDAIENRRAVRDYSERAVDQLTICKLINAATKAPSAMNEQPWAFTVVQDQIKLNALSYEAKAHMLATLGNGSDAPHFHDHLSSPDFQIFYHAPALVLISATVKTNWAVEDCALAAQNLMLAAFGEGLGSCWIGFAQSYLNTSAGKRILDLPDAWHTVAPIIIGHPKTLPVKVARNEPFIQWVEKA